MIKLENVTFRYQTFRKSPGITGTIRDLVHREKDEILAVHPTDLNVSDGEMVGLIGPNGAGKTTLIKMMTGILPPTTGSLTIGPHTPFKRDFEFLNEIGVLLGQKSQLSWDLPAIDTLNMLSQIYQLSPQSYNDRLEELSQMLNTSDLLNIPVRKLSLGQRVRCELMCSLIHSPKYLFLDEPTLGLDILTQDSIYKFLNHENVAHNTTTIVTSHYLQDIENLSNRLLVITEGTIVYDGSTSDLPVDPSKHQKFLVKTFTKESPDKVFSKTLSPEELNSWMKSGNADNLISINREGMSLNDFIRQLYQHGGNN